MTRNDVYYEGPHRSGTLTIERRGDQVLVGVHYTDEGAPAYEGIAIPASQAPAVAEAIYHAGKGERVKEKAA